MSDIKYIIAGDDGEQTRFPCLAMVRYAAAAVVTVLAVAVIAMVIHAVLRSEDIRLNVNNGYIGADKLWSQTNVPKSTTGAQVGVGKLGEPESSTTTSSSVNPNIGGDVSLGHGNDELPEPEDHPVKVSYGVGHSGAAEVTLQRANTTNLRVILIANNPGGRTKIDCNETTVSLIDMQSPGQYEIGKLELGNFTVPPQTTITLQKRLKITNKVKLGYIWDNYGGEFSFSIMLRVNASITSYPLGKKTRTKARTYVCRPVTVGLTDYETYLATDDVECRAEPRRKLAPAPAPAPAP